MESIISKNGIEIPKKRINWQSLRGTSSVNSVKGGWNFKKNQLLKCMGLSRPICKVC